MNRISVPEYETSFYVACFTYMNDISKKHWEEYGYGDEGILYSFKQDWIKKEPIFLNSNNSIEEDIYLKIYSTSREALDASIYEEIHNNRKGCNPYYTIDFDFYQIIYDNKLKKDMQRIVKLQLDDEDIQGRGITPAVVGIIKFERGLCERPGKESYIKEWKEEKEVRLKVGLQSYGAILPSGTYIPKMAVPLKDEAFSKLQIRFNPDIDKNKMKANMDEIYRILPDSEITILN